MKEKGKVSYWLEKLYGQREAMDEEAKINAKNISKTADIESEKSPETKGMEQNIKDQATKIESDKDKVKELVRKSNRRIISISSAFPWTLFPNTIDVEESRVTFNFHQFMSFQSHSVDIKDISNVFIEAGFFFATLQVVSRTFIQNDIKIGSLKKKEAIQVRKIIEGLRVFIQNDIDTSNYEIDELISKLEELQITDYNKSTNIANR